MSSPPVREGPHEKGYMGALAAHVQLYGSVDETTLHLVAFPPGMTTKPHDSARVMQELAPAYGLRYAALPPPRKWCLISEGPSSRGTISPPPAAPHRAFFGDPASLDAVQYASQNPPAPPVLLPAFPGPAPYSGTYGVSPYGGFPGADPASGARCLRRVASAGASPFPATGRRRRRDGVRPRDTRAGYPYAPPLLPGQFVPPAPMPPPPKASTIYSGVVQLFGRTAALGSGKKYGFIRVDETGKEVFVSEAHAPNGWLEKGDRVVFRIIEEENRKGRATAQYKAVDVKLVERVAAEPPVATIDGVAATLNRLQLDATGTSPLANLTAEQKAAIRAAVVAAKTPAELDALERQLRGEAPAPPASPLRPTAAAFASAPPPPPPSLAVVPPPPIEFVAAPPGPEPASVLLRRLGLERLAGIFVSEELDAEALQVVSEDDLVNLGVPRADAKIVLAAVANPVSRSETDLERLRAAEAARAEAQRVRAEAQRERAAAEERLRKASADMDSLKQAEAAKLAAAEAARAEAAREADLLRDAAQGAEAARQEEEAARKEAEELRLEAERKDQAVADAERLRSNAAKESERLRARLEQETDKRSKEAEALKERLIKSQAEADRQRKIMKARGEAAREAQRQRDEMAIEAERLREEAERLREESEAARDAVRLRHEMEEKLRRAEHDRQAQLKNLKKQMQETAERKRNQENQAQREELARLRAMMARRTGEVPDALCCPISMEIMRDPVIAADGHTYERAEIEAWFANNRTSPKTGAVLPHGSLIPNHAAKAMISDFLDEARRHQTALDASMADEVKGAP